jgi:hypothetical protein
MDLRWHTLHTTRTAVRGRLLRRSFFDLAAATAAAVVLRMAQPSVRFARRFRGSTRTEHDTPGASSAPHRLQHARHRTAGSTTRAAAATDSMSSDIARDTSGSATAVMCDAAQRKSIVAAATSSVAIARRVVLWSCPTTLKMRVLMTVLVLAVVVALAAVVGAVPVLEFRLESPLALVYSNNPEQLWPGDLCDASGGGVAVLEQATPEGSYRHFWEYLNQNKCELGFAVVLSNTGSTPL